MRRCWLMGGYRVGIALGSHDIRLGSGDRTFLNDARTVYLRFDAHAQCLEFVHEPQGEAQVLLGMRRIGSREKSVC